MKKKLKLPRYLQTTHLFSQLNQLGKLVVDEAAELGILLGELLHKVRVARRDLGAQLGVPDLEGQGDALVALQF